MRTFFYWLIGCALYMSWYKDLWDGARNVVSKVWNDISDAFSDLLDVIENIVEEIWRSIGAPLVEFVFSLLGYTDETVYTIQVATVPLITETAPSRLTPAVMGAIKGGYSIVDAARSALVGGTFPSLVEYLLYGESTYTHALPTLSGNYVSLDKDELQTVLDTIEGEATTILTYRAGVVPDLDWINEYYQDISTYNCQTRELEFFRSSGYTNHPAISSLFQWDGESYTDSADRYWPHFYQDVPIATSTGVTFGNTSLLGSGDGFSAHFNGSGYIEADFIVGLFIDQIVEQEISLELSLNLDNLSSVHNIISVHSEYFSNENCGAMEVDTAGKIKLYSRIAGGVKTLVYTSTITLLANTTYHIVITEDSDGNTSLYVNGSLDGTNTTHTFALRGIGPLVIGADHSDGTTYNTTLVGTIDDVILYRNVLNQTAVTLHYSAFLDNTANFYEAVVSLGAHSYFKLDSDTTNTIPDVQVRWYGTNSGGILGADFGTYAHATYTIASSPCTRYFHDEEVGAIYPQVFGAIGSGEFTARMLPIVPVRKNFEDVNDSGAAGYDAGADTTSRELLDIVGLDFDDIISNIGDNDDIANIEDAFIIFGTNIHTTSQGGMAALHSVFKVIGDTAEINHLEWGDPTPTTQIKLNVFKIEEQNYNSAVSFNYISDFDYTEVIGPVGTYALEVTILPNDAHNVDGTGGGINSYVTITRQINEYQTNKLKIHGLFMVTNIKTTGTTFKIQTTELSDDPDVMKNFIIPLPLSALNTLSPDQQEIAIYESLHLVIYAQQTTHLEYYETAGFLSLVGIVLEIVAVVLLVISLGASATWSTFLWSLATQILIQYAITLIFMELIQKLAEDGDAARVAAFVLYVYASYRFGGGDTSKLSTAESLLKIVTLTLDAFNINLGFEAELLDAEIKSWTQDQDEKLEELEAVSDLLESFEGLDPYNIALVTNTHPYEEPTDFYQRTIHTGNPGVLTLDQIHNFASDLLRLPEIEVNPSSNLI